MTAQPLELAVFDPSASASGSFLNQLAGGKGTLLIYNDSAYTLKFADTNGTFLKRVLAGTMDKIVICDSPVFRVFWSRALDASGSAIVMSNASAIAMSVVQVDGYQPDAVLDIAVPFAMPRLTTGTTAPVVPLSPGAGITSSITQQKMFFPSSARKTVLYYDTLDRLNISTASLGVCDSGQVWTIGSGGHTILPTAAQALAQFYFSASTDCLLALPASLDDGEITLSLNGTLLVVGNHALWISNNAYFARSSSTEISFYFNGIPTTMISALALNDEIALRINIANNGDGTSQISAGATRQPGDAAPPAPPTALTNFGALTNGAFAAIGITAIGRYYNSAGASPNYIWSVPLMIAK